MDTILEDHQQPNQVVIQVNERKTIVITYNLFESKFDTFIDGIKVNHGLITEAPIEVRTLFFKHKPR